MLHLFPHRSSLSIVTSLTNELRVSLQLRLTWCNHVMRSRQGAATEAENEGCLTQNNKHPPTASCQFIYLLFGKQHITMENHNGLIGDASLKWIQMVIVSFLGSSKMLSSCVVSLTVNKFYLRTSGCPADSAKLKMFEV